MAQLLLLHHHSHRPHKRFFTPKLRIGKYFLMFLMIVMAGIMSLLYLMHFTDIHTKGYTLRKLELERNGLRITKESKQMNIEKVKSLNHIQNSSAVSHMIPARNPIYLKPEAEYAKR